MQSKKENTQTPLMQQYANIKAQYPDVILFFRLGDFYEMFGEDAIKAHQILEVILTKRQTTPMCGVPYHSVNNYIRKLVKAGFKIAICEQLEDPATTKGIVKRGVVRVITPGTLVEDTLLDSKANNFLMSLVLNNKKNNLAVAVADISTGDFFAYETSFINLENEILKYKPNEIVVSETFSQNETLKNVVSKFGIAISTIKDMFVDEYYSKKIIQDTLQVQTLSQFNIEDKPYVICAVGSIFVYVKDNQPQSLQMLTNIRYLNSNNYMVLDSIAIRNLEILKTSSTLRQEGSLLSAIDTTNTPMGARLLKDWLIKPLLDINEIQKRYDKVELFIQNSSLMQEIREDLKSVYDLDRIVSRVISALVNPKELLSLKDSLKVISNIYKKLDSINYFETKQNLEIQEQIINLIENYINPQTPISVKDGNVINSNISKELDELRLLSTNARQYILDLELKEKQKTGISTLKIGYTSVFGYYIDVTKSNLHLVPQEYIRKQTLTNSERYITQELKVLEEKIISAQDKIVKLETEIFSQFRQELIKFTTYLLEVSGIIAQADIYMAFANNAINYHYCKPNITNGKELDLKDSRHPVIEQILQNGSFVANDINLNDNDKRIVILTGPNMSGKSTYLRQIALIVIMAQIGSYVPCSNANIGIVDRIFTRIGAGDNLVAGESTFMVEMTETANILNQYTDRSLIILDEVGRGTSTYDGMSIAWAIIEFFSDEKIRYNKGAKVLFATHYFELTSLATPGNGITNCSVAVKEWNGNVVFLHKIVEGSADKSYGIHVAKLAGIPYNVIKRAYEILHGLEKNINKKFSKIENDLQPNLFTSIEPEILIELKKLEIDSLKPIDALQILYEWKEKFLK